MDRFEFVLVLLSIIVGLGVAELLTNVASQIKARANTKMFWPHSGVVAVILLAFLQLWWESWGLQDVEAWTFPALLLMLGGPVCLLILSHLLFPDNIEGTDFESYYFENARMMWMIAALTVTVSTLFRPIAFGHGLLNMDNLSSPVLLVMFIGLAATKNRTAHFAAVPALIGIMLIDILVFGGEI